MFLDTECIEECIGFSMFFLFIFYKFIAEEIRVGEKSVFLLAGALNT